MTAVVSVRGVSVVLGPRPVLHDVDLDVESGHLVALLGANGSGKSTLVRAVVGLLPLAGGTISLFGGERPAAWRRRVGYVPQRASAQSGVPATVREVVTMGTLSHRRLAGWAGRGDRRAVLAALEQVALADRAGDSVHQLSGGQQQRVMIARALVASPDLLVMDEPLAGVDHESQAVLAELLGSLLAAGTTVLLVAHELGPLGRLVDEAVVLREGRVAYAGPPDRISGAGHLGHADEHHHDRVRPSAVGGLVLPGDRP